MRLILLLLSSLFAGHLHAAPLLILPQPQASQWDWLDEDTATVRRFAMALPTDVDSDRDGLWTESAQGATWRITLQAPQAESLVVQLDQLQWPEQAQLTLENARGQQLGPFTEVDVQGQQFISPIVQGDSVTLHFQSAQRVGAHLRVSQVFYGARSPLQAKHGSCNVDVGSSLIPGHAQQIDSTVLLQIGQGGGLASCSGLLVNNTAGDRLPYVLTADHCGIDASNQDQVRIYWRFEDPNPECGNPPGHQERQPEARFSLQGVEMLADGGPSDFTLMIVGNSNNPRDIPNDFQPFWSGWDVRNTPPQSGVSVHHPNGDEKSISRYDNPAVARTLDIDGRLTQAWEVFWDVGTTEPGSSGAGLWNQDGRVVGVLSGGGASCFSLDEPDYYGRLAVAWQESNNCSGQLKCWLDPGDTGQQRLDGIGPLGSAKASCDVQESGGGGSGALSPAWLLMLVMWRRKKRFTQPR